MLYAVKTERGRMNDLFTLYKNKKEQKGAKLHHHA